MLFLFGLLYDPVKTLDLVDRKGNPDHGKIIPFMVLVWLVERATVAALPSTITLIIILSYSFGWAGWRMYMRSKDASPDA